MKMSMIEAIMVGSAMSVLGYFYMKNNPDIMCKAKKMVKDTSKMIYTKMEKMEKED